jgi:DNA-binding NarL/FixJ family response regulator
VRLSAAEVDVLTPRQAQVVELWRRGWGYRRIAARLDVSPRTVRDHLDAAGRRLGRTFNGEKS